jgi:hypothetical protein
MFHAGWHMNEATGIGGSGRTRDNALVVAMDSADAAEHASGGAASCAGRAWAALSDLGDLLDLEIAQSIDGCCHFERPRQR